MEMSASDLGPARPSIADRLWAAARDEFSQRGYHGARVQGIARRAGCNVALLYRHWASKRALYVDVLRTVWQTQARDVRALLDGGSNVQGMVAALIDAPLRDAVGSQIVVRELLDGGPFLTQLLEEEPALLESMRRASEQLVRPENGGTALRTGLDPMMVLLTVAGVASLVASAHGAARLFMREPPGPERWREHLADLLAHGLLTGAGK